MGVNRSAYWDNWKGLAILAVVAIHATNLTATFPTGSPNWYFGLLFRQVVNFAVPTFFALSGYFAAGSREQGVLEYWRTKVLRLALPYLLWTGIYLVLRGDFPSDPLQLLSGVFLGTGIGIGYYVVVLVQYILLTPVLWQFSEPKHHLIIMIVLSTVGLSVSYASKILAPEAFISSFPGSAVFFFSWYPFYHFGYFVARFGQGWEFDGLTRLLLFSAAVLALVFACFEANFWAIRGYYSLGVGQVKVTCFIFSLSIFLLARAWRETTGVLGRRSGLTWFGENSYAIYLMHLLFLGVAFRTGRSLEGLYSRQPLFVLVSAAATLLGCVCAVIAIKRVLTPNRVRFVLGG